MARVYIPGGPDYENHTTPMTTVSEQVQTGTKPKFQFFGIPFGSQPVYTTQTKDVPLRTPVSSYGVNDTGRTYPFAPNPTSSNYRTVTGPNSSPYRDPQWAGGGQSGQVGAGQPNGGGGSQSNNLGGLLGDILGALFGKKSGPGYEAALRERPQDIQRLVSMSQRQLPANPRSEGGQ